MGRALDLPADSGNPVSLILTTCRLLAQIHPKDECKQENYRSLAVPCFLFSSPNVPELNRELLGVEASQVAWTWCRRVQFALIRTNSLTLWARARALRLTDYNMKATVLWLVIHLAEYHHHHQAAAEAVEAALLWMLREAHEAHAPPTMSKTFFAIIIKVIIGIIIIIDFAILASTFFAYIRCWNGKIWILSVCQSRS